MALPVRIGNGNRLGASVGLGNGKGVVQAVLTVATFEVID
jgi:hypothetical protein